MPNYKDKIYLSQAQLDTIAGGGAVSGYTGDENTLYLVPKQSDWSSLDSSEIGAVTTGEVVSGVFYRNNIAISANMTGVKAVQVAMSNGAIYPAINNNGTQLVIFSGSDFATNGYTVTAVYVSK